MRMKVGRHTVGTGEPLFVVAELGLNHGGSLDQALALVDAAATAGAAAIKLQTLRGEALVAAHCPAPRHVQATSLREFFRQFELDEAAHRAVVSRARAHGLAVLSTPFDFDAVALLERVGVDAYKIASGDVTHHQLIARAAATGKPLVLSTGMSELSEVADALTCARRAGARDLAVLHCVSAYPVPAGEENLRAVGTLGAGFGIPVGLSDHTTYPEAAILAVALGAALYERHFVMSADAAGVDAAVSSTPQQLAATIAAARRAQQALGDGRRTCGPSEAGNRPASRRGLYAARDLPAGVPITADAVVALRPETGIDPRFQTQLIGRIPDQPIPAGAALHADLLRAPRAPEVAGAA